MLNLGPFLPQHWDHVPARAVYKAQCPSVLSHPAQGFNRCGKTEQQGIACRRIG
jgi:hypothetical protein